VHLSCFSDVRIEVFTTTCYAWCKAITVGEDRGFAALKKRQNPAIQIMHCCLRRDASPVVGFEGSWGKYIFRG